MVVENIQCTIILGEVKLALETFKQFELGNTVRPHVSAMLSKHLLLMGSADGGCFLALMQAVEVRHSLFPQRNEKKRVHVLNEQLEPDVAGMLSLCRLWISMASTLLGYMRLKHNMFPSKWA